MAKCEICGREPLKGNQKSHSNIKTIRRQKLNLQTKKIKNKKTIVCTSCIRTMAKPPKKINVKKTK